MSTQSGHMNSLLAASRFLLIDFSAFRALSLRNWLAIGFVTSQLHHVERLEAINPDYMPARLPIRSRALQNFVS